MKGDTTRSTFKPRNHYSSVRMQQGRVQTDADWNEQIDIAAHRVQTGDADIVGRCGAPMHEAGFALKPQGNNLEIGPGRYYAGGILCQNEKATLVSSQPDLPPNAPIVRLSDGTLAPFLPPQPGVYLAYLDVWERHITALDDPSIREVALGGPDTATRSKTVWQVKFLRVGNVGATIHCSDAPAAWKELLTAPGGKLSARAEPSAPAPTPCIVEPGAGYRRLENQHYRVEVHQGGALGTATFKWSRDNGSIVTRWESQDVNKITVSSAGRDKVLGFSSGQWVELIDESREQLGTPGTLVKLAKVEGNVLTIDPATATGPTDLASFPSKPKVRRWDSDGAVKPANTDWVNLEDGVQARFTSGSYRTGDYWLIPARTATADVEWPRDPSTNQPLEQSPGGIAHNYCKLAVLVFDAGAWTLLEDCRSLFPPVTELTSLFYVSGDGQEVMPGNVLPQPLQVGVANGQWPVANVWVRFKRLGGGGALQPGASQVVSSSAAEIVVLTDAKGMAECKWQPDANVANVSQRVEAELLEPPGIARHLPIRFTASLSVASQVAYDPKNCQNLAGAKTVQQALDILCKLTGGQEPGVLVSRLRFTNGDELLNDTDVPVNRLLEGLVVECEEDIDQDTVRNRPTCFLTLEMPFPMNDVDRQLWGNPVIGFTPLVLAAEVNADGNIIFWRPAKDTQAWLAQRLFNMLSEFGRGRRVLARFTLQGNFIWSAENPDLYLDGEVFGMRKEGDPASPTLLRFPSGNAKRGGNLEMWFWLVPPVTSPPAPGGLVLVAAVAGVNIIGSLRDSSGAPFPGAQIVLTGGTAARTTVTNAAGNYVFGSLTPGTYLVTARAANQVAEQRVVVRAASPNAVFNPAEFPDATLTEVTGVGPAFRERLESSGVTHPAHVASMRPEDLAPILGVPESRAATVIANSRRLLRR